MNVLSWVGENWTVVVGVCGSVVMGASLIVKAIAPLTKNKTDDKVSGWLDKAYSFLNKLALNPPRK